MAAAIAVSAFLCGACGEDVERPPAEPVGAARFEVTTHVPARLHGLDTTLTDVNGRVVTVSCATCHDGRDASGIVRPEDLEEFHTEMTFDHGLVTCASCHHPDRRDLLRLADGQTLPMSAAMDLCGQCHGPQRRDYDRGSHGGASGYWDLSRGERERNHCIDCHDPHAPAYPAFEPMPPPRDRFLGGPGGH